MDYNNIEKIAFKQNKNGYIMFCKTKNMVFEFVKNNHKNNKIGAYDISIVTNISKTLNEAAPITMLEFQTLFEKDFLLIKSITFGCAVKIMAQTRFKELKNFLLKETR